VVYDRVLQFMAGFCGLWQCFGFLWQGLVAYDRVWWSMEGFGGLWQGFARLWEVWWFMTEFVCSW
jgi:hypothetical protein